MRFRISRILACLMLLSMVLAASAMAQGDAPRLGTYKIFSYGAVSHAPLYLGHFVLMPGGVYKVSRTSSDNFYGEGKYSFSGTNVVWLSGPFKTNGWTGTFTIEREGKTHKIRLAPTTIGTNSTD